MPVKCGKWSSDPTAPTHAPAGSASSSASVPQARDERFQLDVAVLTLKHLQKLVTSGVLPIEDQSQAVKKIRDTMLGQYAKEQIEAATLAVS